MSYLQDQGVLAAFVTFHHFSILFRPGHCVNGQSTLRLALRTVPSRTSLGMYKIWRFCLQSCCGLSETGTPIQPHMYIYIYVPGSRFASPPPNGMVPQEPPPCQQLPITYVYLLPAIPYYLYTTYYLLLHTTTYYQLLTTTYPTPPHPTGGGGIGRCYYY